MKIKLTMLVTLLFLTLTSWSVTKAPSGKYNLDPSHTRVSFSVAHFVISEVEGRFDAVQGNYVLADKFPESSAEAVIQIKSVNTNEAKRDEHLRSADFFDADKYPTMTFKSKKFSGSPEDFKVVGNLTIKNVTKEVTLKGKSSGSVKDPYGNTRIALKMNGKINRKDFNVMFNKVTEAGPVVGDEVSINIVTEGILEESKK